MRKVFTIILVLITALNFTYIETIFAQDELEPNENVSLRELNLSEIMRGEHVEVELFTSQGLQHVTVQGQLPEGLSIDGALVKGSPSQLGSFEFTVRGSFESEVKEVIVRGDVIKSNNTNLIEIAINNVKLPSFSKEILTYSYLLKANTSITAVTATLENEFATYQVTQTPDKVVITVTADNGIDTKVYTVNVNNEVIPIQKVTVDQKSFLLLVDQEIEVKFQITPGNTTETVTWSVKDSRIATFKDGKITAVKRGNTTLIAKSPDGKTHAEIPVEVVLGGDADLNGRVDISDAIAVLRHVVGAATLNASGIKAADVNGDSRVDITDAINILRYIVGSDSVLGPGPLSGRIIFLDPGHGGKDPGAVAHGYRELDLNDQLATLLARHLREAGATVLFTREPFQNLTLGMPERIEMINNSNADIMISIHHDGSTNQNARGATTFYSTYRPAITTEGVYVLYQGRQYEFIEDVDGGFLINFHGTIRHVSFAAGARAMTTNIVPEALKSIVLADLVQKALVGTGLNNRGTSDGNLYMTRWPNIPAVLFEAGFMTNLQDVTEAAKPSVQDQRARAITQAIIEYFQKHH